MVGICLLRSLLWLTLDITTWSHKGNPAIGYPYYKGSAIFSLVFLSTTSEKSLIPPKASVAVQALKVCPVRPRVLSSWGITLLEKLRAADES